MTVMGDSVGMLEENAAKRKERLAALKRKLGGQEEKTGVEEEGGDMEVDPALPTPVFRSYKPTAEELADNALDPAEPSAIEEQIQVIKELDVVFL